MEVKKMNGANGKKSNSLTNHRGAKNPPGALKFKRSILSLFLITSFLLATGTASAITIHGDLPNATTHYIVAYEGDAGGSTPCAGAGQDNNTQTGDADYTNSYDYYISWVPSSPVDVNIWFCDTQNGSEEANYTQSGVAIDADLNIDLGKVFGTTVNNDLDQNYVFVCDDINGNLLSYAQPRVDISQQTDYSVWYAFNANTTSSVYVFMDKDNSDPCIWDNTKSTGRKIDCFSDDTYERRCDFANFAPLTKAQGYLHNDFDYGWMAVYNSYLGGDGNTNKLMIGMAKFGDLGNTEAGRYTLYYDDTNSGSKYKVQLFKNPNPAITTVIPDMNILQVPASFTSLDANIKINGDVPTEIDQATSMIGGVDYQTTDLVNEPPKDYNLYVPISTPTVQYWDSGVEKYQYTYGGSINADQTLNIGRVSGEAHSDLENAPNAGIQVFTDNTCGTEATQASGDPNYIVQPTDDSGGVDYNIYFQGSDGTYYLLVWYNDGSGDFNTCGNAVTLSNEEATANLTVELSGIVPSEGTNRGDINVDIDQDGAMDANTDDINSEGIYHLFTVPAIGATDANVNIDNNVGETVLTRVVDLTGDATFNGARVYGETHTDLENGSGSIRIFSDSGCTTLVSGAPVPTIPSDGAGVDYNIYYEHTGGTTYYIEATANIGGSNYVSCIKLASYNAGSVANYNIDTKVSGKVPNGVDQVALDVGVDGDYDSNTTTINSNQYYLYTQATATATDANFLAYDGNVLLSRSANISADETLDVARITGQLHSDLQGASDAFDIFTAFDHTNQLSSEDANVGNGYYTQYYEVPAAGTDDVIMSVKNVETNTYYLDINIPTVANSDAAIQPGDTDTYNLTNRLVGKVPTDLKMIWATSWGPDTNSWDFGARVNQTDGNYQIYSSGTTDINISGDEDYSQVSGVNLSFIKDISAVKHFDIDAIRGQVPWDFFGASFEIETPSMGDGCGGARIGKTNSTSGGLDTVTDSTYYDYQLYVDANTDDYNVLFCNPGGTLLLNRYKHSSSTGGQYHDLNVGKISGETLSELKDNTAADDISVFDANNGTLLSSEAVQPVDDGTAQADYNVFFETTTGTTYYYLRAHSDQGGTAQYTSWIKVPWANSADLNTVYNIDTKLYGTYVAGVESAGVYLNGSSDWNAYSNDKANGNWYEVYTTAGNGTTDRAKFFAGDNLGTVLLDYTAALNADNNFHVSRVTGNAHADLQETTNTRNNVEVYNTGPATCGTLLSSENIKIGTSYTQYYKSDSSDSIYIKVVDRNGSYDYNTCIDIESNDVNATSTSFNLDKRLAGYVASGITTVRIDRAQDGDEAYSTVVTGTTPNSYISYSPGNTSTDVSFYSSGPTLELDRTGKNSTSDLMVNVGKVSGETATDLETGGNGDVQVFRAIANNACNTQISSETEAPVENSGGADFTQYFEAADGAYDDTFYFIRYTMNNGTSYNTCDLNGFKTTNLEYAGANAEREVSGTVPDLDAGDPDILYVMADINGSGTPNAATTPVDGGASTKYYLFLNAGNSGAGDDVNFYSDSAGTVEEFGKTLNLGSNQTIDVSLVFGETGTALESGSDSVAVCASGLPNTYTDTTCGSYASSVTQHPGENAGVADYNVFFEQTSGQTGYFLQIKDMNDFGGQNWVGSDHNFYSYHKFSSATAGSRIDVNLTGSLTGYLSEEYNPALPIADVNVNLTNEIGRDWNAFTFTNVDGNYVAYSGGVYDLQYTKTGYITRDWSTNPGEMNDVALSAVVDTNLLNGIIVTVQTPDGNLVTNATVEVLDSLDGGGHVLVGCTNTNTTSCTRTGDNTAGNGASGKYYFSGFSLPQAVWVRAYRTGWSTDQQPIGTNPQVITSTGSPFQPTLTIENAATASLTLIAPGNGTSVSTLTPTLSWYDLGADEVDYNVQVATDASFTSLVVDYNSNGGDDTTYVVGENGESPLVNGTTYYWRVAAVDLEGLGNWSEIRSFTVDTSAPTINSFSIDEGAAYTKSRAVTLDIDATGATYCSFSNYSDSNWSPWNAYDDGNSYSWTLTAGDGTKTVYAMCKDDANNVVGPTSDTIVMDTTPPSSLSFTINDGNQFTNQANISVDTNAYEAYSMTCYWSLDNSTWTAFASCTQTNNTAITLPATDGLKEVFFKAVDAAGNTTSTSDTIVFDATAPSAPTATATTSNNQITITWTASTDTTSGVDHYKIYRKYNASGVTTSDTLLGSVAATTQSFVDEPTATGTYYYAVLAVDRTGNTGSLGTEDNASVDFNAPEQASIVINDGNLYTTSTSVTIDTNAQNASVCQYKTEDDTSWTDISCASTDVGITLSGGEGVKTVYFKAVDANQNVAEASDTIIYDASAPTAPSNLTATSVTNQVLLSWSPGVDGVSGIARYNIYRSTTSGSTGSLIGTSQGLAYTDSPGMTGTYYYTVRATNNAGLTETNTTQANASVDYNGPVALAVSINDGNLYTNSVNVSIATSVWGANTCEYTTDVGQTWNAATCNGTTAVTLPAGDGDKNVCVRAIDANNNYISSCDTIYLDTTAPTTPTAAFPTSAITTIGRDFQWQWTASAGTGSPVDHYLVTLSDGTILDQYTTKELYSKDYSRNLNNGKVYVLAVVAFDEAGNNSGTLTFSNVTIDLNSPITRVNAPTGDTNNATPTVNVTVSSAVTTCQFLLTVNSGQSFIDSEPVTATSNVCSWTVPAGSAMSNGDTFSIQATVTDAAGKERTLTLPKNYAVDTTAPTVTISTPTTSSTLADTTPRVSFKAASANATNDVNLASILVQRNNANVTQSFNTSNCYLDGNAWNCSFDIPAGSAFTDGTTGNNIFIRVFDNAGNYTDAWVTDLNVDTTDYITLNSITAVSTLGQADDTNAHAWKWDFNVSFGVGSLGEDKNKLRFKLANWTSSTTNTTLYVDGNAEMVYDANINGTKTTMVYNLKNTYDTSQTVYPFWDHNPLTAAIDANFYIQQRIPSSIASGQYSSSYGIKTYSS